MPPENVHDLPVLYVKSPDEKTFKIGEVRGTQIVYDEYDEMEDGRFFLPSKTATFTVTWNPGIDAIYLLIHGRLPSNNWRKMNGYPLRRKTRNRREKQ